MREPRRRARVHSNCVSARRRCGKRRVMRLWAHGNARSCSCVHSCMCAVVRLFVRAASCCGCSRAFGSAFEREAPTLLLGAPASLSPLFHSVPCVSVLTMHICVLCCCSAAGSTSAAGRSNVWASHRRVRRVLLRRRLLVVRVSSERVVRRWQRWQQRGAASRRLGGTGGGGSGGGYTGAAP
jgi:hypothetical protein